MDPFRSADTFHNSRNMLLIKNKCGKDSNTNVMTKYAFLTCGKKDSPEC